MEPHSRDHASGHVLQAALLLLLTVTAGARLANALDFRERNLSESASSAVLARIKSGCSLSFQYLLGCFGYSSRHQFTFWDMVKLTTACGLLPGLILLRRHSRQNKDKRTPSVHSGSDVSETSGIDAVTTDPGLLKKHSTYKSYTVPGTGFTYPCIRTFFRPHPQGDKLPSTPAPVPLLVFIHGLGGSVVQFHPLLISLVNLAPCLSIDLPGCGLSEFEPRSWEAYTVDAMVQLLAEAIEAHRDAERGQGVVLIGHSMGASLAALLASSTSPYHHLISRHVLGLVGICPKAEPPTAEEAAKFKKLLTIPGPIFDLWRRWDRRGGLESASIKRFTGPGAEEETKKLQLRFNEQSKTPVWRRMAMGTLPDYSTGVLQGGLPGRDVWVGLEMPVFLAAGESDPVTPPDEVRKIAEFLGKPVSEKIEDDGETIPDSAAPVSTTLSGNTAIGQDTGKKEVGTHSPVDSASLSSSDENVESIQISKEDGPTERRRVLKTTVLPIPASHALLYAPSTSRTLAGLIGAFLSNHIDKRLSLGWQLQFLTTEGKWDVKNLAKWKAVNPVSEPIAGTFRAMKTLREVDEKHSPKVFVSDWKGKIRAVVDISHESPVYDPNGLEAGGIMYQKFPTVSKLPPTVDEVKCFITLIDSIPEAPATEGGEKPLIGVHCHYGFNRTGFFIVCYLVERLGYRLQDAIDEFAKRRPPGIRHEHFIDTLYVRYCVGLKRAPTL